MSLLTTSCWFVLILMTRNPQLCFEGSIIQQRLHQLKSVAYPGFLRARGQVKFSVQFQSKKQNKVIFLFSSKFDCFLLIFSCNFKVRAKKVLVSTLCSFLKGARSQRGLNTPLVEVSAFWINLLVHIKHENTCSFEDLVGLETVLEA